MKAGNKKGYDNMSGPGYGIMSYAPSQEATELAYFTTEEKSFVKYLKYERTFNFNIQRGLCIHPRRKLIFYKPGRIMGTNLFRNLLQRYGGWHIKKNDAQRDFKSWVKRIKDKQLIEYTKCIITRNPFSRIVSAYQSNSKVRYANNEGLPRFQRHCFADHLSFDEYVEKYYTNPSIPPPDIHSIPMYKFFSSGKSTQGNPDYWGKMENIENDWKTIHRAFGLDGWKNKPHIKWPKYTGDINAHRKHYTKNTKDIVREYYKKDLELFNYDF